MAANSIARSVARKADCRKLPYKHATGITKAHANRGFAVKLSALSDKFGQATVEIVDTAGDHIIGELCDVHDDGTCSVEVRDMIFRTNNTVAAADLGGILAGRGTVDGDADVNATVREGPIVYGGFVQRDEGLATPANVNFFRAERLG